MRDTTLSSSPVLKNLLRYTGEGMDFIDKPDYELHDNFLSFFDKKVTTFFVCEVSILSIIKSFLLPNSLELLFSTD